MDKRTKGLVLVTYMEEVVLDVLREAELTGEELGPVDIGRRSGIITEPTGKSDSKLINALIGQMERKGLVRRIDGRSRGMGKWVLKGE